VPNAQDNGPLPRGILVGHANRKRDFNKFLFWPWQWNSRTLSDLGRERFEVMVTVGHSFYVRSNCASAGFKKTLVFSPPAP
jgi:hypothetical protein